MDNSTASSHRPTNSSAKPAERNVIAVSHTVSVAERATRYGHVGAVIWLTGLSASGKSTMAMALERALFARSWSTYVLDGDNLRHGLNADLGFSPKDRSENVRRIGRVAALFADAGQICISACISPFQEDRAAARTAAQPHRFIEIHVSADLNTCEGRDPKGLYRKARSGSLPGFTGIDSPYEVPHQPDLVLNTQANDIATCLRTLETLVVAQCQVR
ncbi:adenylyl-sulfate kinase [Diaphorobacter sp. HDW4A]|uniref:adenylyl-sulfate kinase n=1 Tax=Diaphorobacter sp. HDW4A TaxID=2714924 RepID=UPI00140B7262|nr:adenylyl-sulfate kinase [Diaphorobacter sp. HDW4A]QIL80954.1 adenylyl-sulfate kinase [Diaphorobacter sp. HDW4A]